MRAICLVSGGMDSCVTVAEAHAANHELFLLHINYGQRTEQRELQAFQDIALHYRVPASHTMSCSIQHLAAIGGSSLTDKSIPVTEANLHSTEIPTSYVPFRNAHMLSIAVSWAEVCGAKRVYIGAVYEDSSGYPDCRPEYYEAFNRVVKVGTAAGDIKIVTPIIHLRKDEIVKRAVELSAPLAKTWSCYQSEDEACGICDSCALRLRGFQRAGIIDPISYRSRPLYQ